MLLRLRGTALAGEIEGNQYQAFLEFQGNRGCLLLRFQSREVVSMDLPLHGQGLPDLATSTEEAELRSGVRTRDRGTLEHTRWHGFLLFDCAVQLAGFQFPTQGSNLGCSSEN